MECFHLLYSPLQITVKNDVDVQLRACILCRWNVPDFGCSEACEAEMGHFEVEIVWSAKV